MAPVALATIVLLVSRAAGFCQKPPGGRKVLYNGSYYNFTIGRGLWTSPQPYTEIMRILLEEEMGVYVEPALKLFPSSAAGLRGVIGCTEQNCDDVGRVAGVWQDPPPAMVAPEMWTTSEEEKRLVKYTGQAGPVGYVSTPSLMTFNRTIAAAEAGGELLGYWRSLFRPSVRQYFSKVTALNASIHALGFTPAAGAGPSYDSLIAQDGLVIKDGWYSAPTCASNIDTCIPVVLAVAQWNFIEYCRVARDQNLPLAITYLGFVGWMVGTRVMYTQGHSFLFYSWRPDNTFSEESPEMCVIANEVLPIKQFQYNQKVTWSKLADVDPDIYGFLSRMAIDNTQMDIFMEKMDARKPAPMTAYDVACEWVKANSLIWQKWLPDKTNCRRGFFYSNQSTSCEACKPGTITTRNGRTECQPCPPGQLSTSLAGTRCEDCELGKYGDKAGTSLCTFCPVATYGASTGRLNCTRCFGTLVTADIASTSESACICPAKTYETFLARACEPCPEGMKCMMGSKEANFKMISYPGFVYPQVLQGFYTAADEPLSVYKCGTESWCPGGPPNFCAGERYGIGCAECPNGKNPSADGCKDCDAGIMVLAVLCSFLAVMAFPIFLYYGANSRVAVATTGSGGFTISAGICIASLQVLATYQRLQLPWPSSSRELMDSVGFVLFDGGSVGIQCLIGNGVIVNYLLRVLFTYVLLLIFSLLWALSKVGALVIKKLEPWEMKKTVNAAGAFLQVAFISLVGIAVMPLQCYAHPNGKRSVVAYPGVLCAGEGDYPALVALGVTLFVTVIVPFLVVTMIAVWKAPSASRLYGGNSVVIICCRFLVYRFRPDRWYWGIVFSFRQLIIAVSPIVASNDGNVQMMLVACNLVVYALLLGRFWPWKTDELNILDAISVFFLLMIAVTSGSFMEVSEAMSTHESFIFTFLMVIIVVNCAIMLFALVCFVRRGISGDFGITYPTRKTIEHFAHEWRSLAAYHKDIGIQKCMDWLGSMNNFDRVTVDTAISICQSHSIGGKRVVISLAAPPRLVADSYGPAELIEAYEEAAAPEASPQGSAAQKKPGTTAIYV